MISNDAARRIIALIGMLGSDLDGEVLAAARAIGRILAADGCTFADLKAKLGGNGEAGGVRACAADLMANLEAMEDYEADFVRNMHARLTIDPDFRMTTKQSAWFARLISEYC